MSNESSRRQILLMSALAAAAFVPIGKVLGAAGAGAGAGAGAASVDAGALAEYAEDGVFDHFAAQGFFIIRKDGRIAAQSSVCTHQRGRLMPAGDGFICTKHHSAFTMDGKVTRPPARTDLVRYAVWIDEKKHLIVDMGKRIEHTQFDAAGAYVEAPSA